MIQTSPFEYGRIVGKEQFIDREKEVKQMTSNLIGGINVMLLSPRRMGKSSLVEKMSDYISSLSKDYKVIQIDLFSIESREEFLSTFTKEVLKASYSKVEEFKTSIKTMLSSLVPKISFSFENEIDINIGFNKKEIRKAENEILNLPEEISKRKGCKYIICIDEFQDLANFEGFTALEKRMRAVWQRQKLVTYCLYGSKRHMMEDIFSNPSKPFYRFGELMSLGKISTSNWVKYIVDSFKQTNKNISKNLATLMVRVVENHSWYVQQFSHFVWLNTDKEVNIDIIIMAYEQLIDINLPFFQKSLDELIPIQRNLLRAIINGETRLSKKDVIEEYNLGTSASVVKAKRTLDIKEVLVIKNKKAEFIDPVFKVWLRNLYYKKDYKNIIKNINKRRAL
jgi:hypothetical protein